MSAAVVHQPRTILPKFNFLLAGTAVVLSIIAITDNVGSNTATVTKPAAVATQKPGAGTARPEHAVVAHGVAAKAPAVSGRILDESRLAHEVGAKVTSSQPSVGRLLNDVGPVQASTVAGTCGIKVSTTC